MANFVQMAVEIVSAGRQLQEAHQKTMAAPGDRRAYEFGFSDGLHSKPQNAHPDTSKWDDPEWSPEQYQEGYAFGTLVRTTARRDFTKCRPNVVRPRPDTPHPLDCHRPADARYRDGNTEHDDTHSKVLMDLPASKDGGIVYRCWEGCIGCGAIRPVDEFHSGTVKWRAWRWRKGQTE